MLQAGKLALARLPMRVKIWLDECKTGLGKWNFVEAIYKTLPSSGECQKILVSQPVLVDSSFPCERKCSATWFNTLRPRQNDYHFADDIFRCIFMNERICILIKISLKFVLKGPINSIPALVQVMARRQTGDKPLSEPMMALVGDAYMHHSASMS